MTPSALIDGCNERCHPFAWTKTAEQILNNANHNTTHSPGRDAFPTTRSITALLTLDQVASVSEDGRRCFERCTPLIELRLAAVHDWAP